MYVVRENGSPCENLTFAVFSTHDKAQRFIDQYYPTFFKSPEDLWIDAHVLDTADPKTGRSNALDAPKPVADAPQ